MANVKTVTGTSSIVQKNIDDLRSTNPVIPNGVIVKPIGESEYYIGDGLTSFNDLRPMIGNIRLAGKGKKITNTNIPNAL